MIEWDDTEYQQAQAAADARGAAISKIADEIWLSESELGKVIEADANPKFYEATVAAAIMSMRVIKRVSEGGHFDKVAAFEEMLSAYSSLFIATQVLVRVYATRQVDAERKEFLRGGQ